MKSRFPMKPHHLMWIVPMGFALAVMVLCLFYAAWLALKAIGQFIVTLMNDYVAMIAINPMALTISVVIFATVGSFALYAILDAEGRWERIKKSFTSNKTSAGTFQRSQRRAKGGVSRSDHSHLKAGKTSK